MPRLVARRDIWDLTDDEQSKEVRFSYDATLAITVGCRDYICAVLKPMCCDLTDDESAQHMNPCKESLAAAIPLQAACPECSSRYVHCSNAVWTGIHSAIRGLRPCALRTR